MNENRMPMRRAGLGRRGTVVGALAASVLAATATLGAPAAAAPADGGWRIVDLGSLGGECCTNATALNDRGEVVGSSTSPTGVHAFLWRAGRMIDLGTLGGSTSVATGINNRGEVVGYSHKAGNSGFAAFRWYAGRMTELPSLGGSTVARGINDRGEIVGQSQPTGSSDGHAVVWHAGVITDLGTLGGVLSDAAAINNRGDIVGSASQTGIGGTAVRWRAGRAEVLLGGRDATATATNDRGDVVGDGESERFAFILAGGTLTEIPEQAGAGSALVRINGINNRGEVVGETGAGAFVWRAGRMTALPALPGTSVVMTAAINDRGQAVGTGVLSDQGGSLRAVLWTR